jgi:hypothetical protein
LAYIADHLMMTVKKFSSDNSICLYLVSIVNHLFLLFTFVLLSSYTVFPPVHFLSVTNVSEVFAFVTVSFQSLLVEHLIRGILSVSFYILGNFQNVKFTSTFIRSSTLKLDTSSCVEAKMKKVRYFWHYT